MYIVENHIDDLLRRVLQSVLASKTAPRPTKGGTLERSGVLLHLKNPRARVSRTDRKGTLFSAIGEFLWYLSGSNRVDHIAYYLREYAKFAEADGTVHGAYGPRLNNLRGVDQVKTVIDLLRRKPDSRRAVIQLFDAGDLERDFNDVPCTCSVQFLRREGRLHMFTSMRSNDAYRGLPHDIFCFTMLQELVARSLGDKLGTYKHFVASLHVYDSDRAAVKRYLNEGYQEAKAMPPMPSGDQWAAVVDVLSIEQSIRTGGAGGDYTRLAPYWQDIARLLEVFNLTTSDTVPPEVGTLRRAMSHELYRRYVDRRVRSVAKKA